MVATRNGLVLIDLETYAMCTVINDWYADVCFYDNTVFALNTVKKTVDVIRHNGFLWIETE